MNCLIHQPFCVKIVTASAMHIKLHYNKQPCRTSDRIATYITQLIKKTKQYHLYVIHSPIVHNQKTKNKTKQSHKCHACKCSHNYSMQSLKQSHIHVMHVHIVHTMWMNQILSITECQLVSQLPCKVYARLGFFTLSGDIRSRDDDVKYWYIVPW